MSDENMIKQKLESLKKDMYQELNRLKCDLLEKKLKKEIFNKEDFNNEKGILANAGEYLKIESNPDLEKCRITKHQKAKRKSYSGYTARRYQH